MSILIHGMEMPGCCGDCQFQASRWTGDFCSAGQFMFGIDFDYRDKHQKCPLVPLTEGHGRLVDAERFRVILCRLKERQNDDVATHALNWAIECLDKMDTIIPAEGGTDECSEN